jgi:uncharacterized protein YjbI with pentapeptide repeats
MTGPRLTYEQSCQRLQELGGLPPGDPPPVPARLPMYDDGELAIRFSREHLEGVDLSNLSLPRTFFGRSQLTGCSFANTDLAESNLCWNDFNGVDFTSALLARSDLRSSLFDNVILIGADLSGADMRRSTFTGCRFDGALMTDAILCGREGLDLSEVQVAAIDWREDEGPEPGGG